MTGVKWILGVATGLWAAVLVVQVGTWSAVHAVPLQGRDVSVTLPVAAEWRAVHVLVHGCPCSRTLAAYLTRRGPQPGWQEQVWILDGAAAESLPGFTVTVPSRSDLEASGLVGGPRLLLFSPDGRLVWNGGYGSSKPSETSSITDLDTMLAVRGGASPHAAPVFGCPRRSLSWS